jgi:hypothetical protein
MAKVERETREASKGTHEAYWWRGEESRETGPVDKSYDPNEAQRQRDARSVPTPKRK